MLVIVQWRLNHSFNKTACLVVARVDNKTPKCMFGSYLGSEYFKYELFFCMIEVIFM